MTAAEQEQTERDITFFVACFNEELNIVEAIEAVLKAAAEAGKTFDIVIVDDASTDRSVQVIRDYMDKHPDLPIKLVINQKNQGLGVNYAEACFHGNGRYYRLICGDNEERYESIVKALKQLGQADMILTYHDNNQARAPSRRFVSRTYTGIVNVLSGHKLKYYNGLPILLRSNVLRWHSHAHGFGFQADLIVRLLDMGATFVEVPVTAKNRAEGSTNAFTFRNLASVGHTLLQIFVRRVAMMMFPRYASTLSFPPQVEQTPSFDEEETLAAAADKADKPVA